MAAASMLLLWVVALFSTRGVFCMQQQITANIEEAARAITEFNATADATADETRPRKVHRNNFHRRWHHNNHARAMRKMSEKSQPSLEELGQHEMVGQQAAEVLAPAIVTTNAHASSVVVKAGAGAGATAAAEAPAMAESSVASASLVQSHMESLKRYAKENPAKFAVCIAIFFFVWIIGCVPTSGDLSIKAEQRMMKHAPPVGSNSSPNAPAPSTAEQRSRVRTQSH